MRKLFSDKSLIFVGHNIQRFDIPTLERLLGIEIKSRLIDTLALAWYLEPNRSKYGLEYFGEDFGIPKPKVEDWENLDIEIYKHRCKEDVKINTRLWKLFWNKLLAIYKSNGEASRFLSYLEFKIDCARKQERDKWKLDVKYAEESLIDMMRDQRMKVMALREKMPKVPVIIKKNIPKRMYNRTGTLTKLGREWYDLLNSRNLPFDSEEVEIIKGYEEGNPSSPKQLKDWLFSLGWKPQTFKYKKDSEGKQKEIPQINKENGGGLCDSIKLLYEKEPILEELDGLSILNHRIPLLSSFLQKRNSQDFIQAKIAGLTNTLRFKHAEIVNLPRTNRPYAKGIRGSLVAPEGYELCGADMSSLEDRLKQHYIFPLDPDYVRSMMRDDYDPHLALAQLAGRVTPEQAQKYVKNVHDIENNLLEGDLKEAAIKYNKKIKPTRDIFKNGNYACQYGAYPPRLSITCGISLVEAKEVFDTYWEMNWAIKKVSEEQVVQDIQGEKWLLNPVNGFWYSLRTENDRFSTLVQGTAAYVFDMWVQKVIEKRDQLTAQFHDEIVLTVKKGFREEATKLLEEAINETNEMLKLNRELAIGIQYGDRYSDIH